MTCPITADRDAWRGAVTQADRDLAASFWRVHPNEIIATGMTREEWYAHHIAAHRQQAEASFKAREDALVAALQRLEWANEQLAANRPQAAYEAYLDAGQADALLGLDVARQHARALLARAHTATDAGGEE